MYVTAALKDSAVREKRAGWYGINVVPSLGGSVKMSFGRILLVPTHVERGSVHFVVTYHSLLEYTVSLKNQIITDNLRHMFLANNN